MSPSNPGDVHPLNRNDFILTEAAKEILDLQAENQQLKLQLSLRPGKSKTVTDYNNLITRLQNADAVIAKVRVVVNWFDSDDNKHSVPCQLLRNILPVDSGAKNGR